MLKNKKKRFNKLNEFLKSKSKMMLWANKLFPICRSITGEGIRQTLSFFEKINPDLKRLKFKTKQKVFDWEIPNEWNINDAYFQHVKTNKKYALFKKNNLHVVNYSIPKNKIVTKKELVKNLYYLKNQPNAIPYVTSYYKKKWGFCISYNQFKKLPNGEYKIYIDSTLKPGFLDLDHALLKGKKNKEIFFSSYVCHPSMANNELTGPILLNLILKYIKSLSKTNYSYRFCLIPETIGSIAYLSKYHKEMKKNIICGFNLSCLGDRRGYSYVKSRLGNTLADESLSSALFKKKNFITYSFFERGSDERQYCSPGIDLPVCNFSRSKYGTYPEYHTSLDNLNLINQKGLEESLSVMISIIDCFELGIYPKPHFLCEPQLSKRNLYPHTSSKNHIDKDAKIRKNFLAYCDGKTTIFKIAKLINCSLENLVDEYKLLKQKKILQGLDTKGII